MRFDRLTYRAVLIIAIIIGLLAAPVVAQEFNTYLVIGGVHWVWCGNAADGTDGRVWVYPITEWAVKIECVPQLPQLPEKPPVEPVAYFPIVFGGSYAP